MAAKPFAHTLAVLVLGLATMAVAAQGYPGKYIRMIVPFPPGGGVDFIGRTVGQKLAERLNQQVIIDNRAGANGIVGMLALKSAAPDGYTIGAASSGQLVINPFVYAKLGYEPVRDYTYISMAANIPMLLVAHTSLPVKNARDLIALARSRPGEISYSSAGAGNAGNLAAELFNSMAKISILHVPYKGTAAAVIAVLSGETQLSYTSIPTIAPHVRSGRVRALGIGNAKRIPSMPDIPTIAESGLPGYEAYAWGGIIGPANLPGDIVQRLNKEVIEIMKSPDVVTRMLREGMIPTSSSPEEFGAYLKVELKKWGDVVKLANIKAE